MSEGRQDSLRSFLSKNNEKIYYFSLQDTATPGYDQSRQTDNTVREAAKKVPPLEVRPLRRPRTPSPTLELSRHRNFFFIVFRASRKSLSLVVCPPPHSLSHKGRATSGGTFFAAFLISVTFRVDCKNEFQS